MRCISLYLCLFICLAGASAARATVRIIPSAYPTLDSAYTAAAPGDTIRVDSIGVMAERLFISKPITLWGPNRLRNPNTAARLPESVLRAPTGATLDIFCTCPVVIEGFTIEGTDGPALVSRSGSLILRNNIFIGTTAGAGLVLGSNLDTVTVSQNLFRNIRGVDAAALQLAVSNHVRIEYNVVDTAASAGFILDGLHHADVRRNQFRRTRRAGLELTNQSAPCDSVFVTENVVESCNLDVMADVGGLRVFGGANGFVNTRITHNIVRSSYNGIAVRNLSNLKGQDIKFQFNILENNINAAFYHGGTGVAQAEANWWGSANGPAHARNNLASPSNQRVIALSDTLVQYSPWLEAAADKFADTLGWQRPAVLTFVAKRAAPDVGSVQKAIDLAWAGDRVRFPDAAYAEGANVVRNLTFLSSARAALRDVDVHGDTTLKTLWLNGPFTFRNLTMMVDTGGRVFTGADTLQIDETMSEMPGRLVYGYVKASRSVGVAGNTFGNIGLELANGPDNLGQVTVVRANVASVSLLGRPSILRRFHLTTTGATPAGGRPINFRWYAEEDNNLDLTAAAFWRRADGLANWTTSDPGRDLSAAGDPRVLRDTIYTRGSFTVGLPDQCRGLRLDLPRTAFVCEGDTSTIGLRASGGNGKLTYSWTPRARLLSPDSALTGVFPDTVTRYKLSVTDSLGCVVKDSVLVEINRKPDVGVGPTPRSICAGNIVQLNATGGAGYVWSPSVGLSNPFIGNPTAVLTRDTIVYTVTATAANNCSRSTSITLYRLPKPIPGVNRDTVMCPGNSIRLRASGGVNYRWQPEVYLSNPFVQDPVALIKETVTYTVTVRAANGCEADTTVKLTLGTPPLISAGPDVTICAGEIAQMRVAGNPKYKYQWSPAQYLDQPTAYNPVFAPDRAGIFNYIVYATDQYNCQGSDTITIRVNLLPTVVVSADATICPGDSAAIAANGGGDYEWTPREGLSDAFARDPKAAPAKTTKYTVRVTGLNGCSASREVMVKVAPTPTAFAGLDHAICDGHFVQLKAEGGVRYAWAPAASLDDAESASPVASPVTTTDYVLTAYNSYDCADTDTVRVTVAPRPELRVVGVAPICPGVGREIQANGGQNYAWSPAAGLSNANIANPVATPDVTTTYTVIATGPQGCSDTATVQVVVVAAGAALITPAPLASMCGGNGVTLNALDAPGVAYQWYYEGAAIAGATGPIYLARVTGQYAVEVQNADACRALSAPTTVVERPAVQADAGADVAICRNGAGAQLQARGGVQYRWEPATGLSDANVANPVATPVQSTLYTLTVTDVSGCTGVDSVLVFVNSPQTPEISVVGAAAACADSYVLVRADFPQPVFNLTYRWLRDGVQAGETKVPTFEARQSGQYTVEAMFPGCGPRKSDNHISVTVFPLPNVDAGPDATNCAGAGGSDARSTADGEQMTFLWEPATGVSNPAILRPRLNPNNTTTYTLTAKDGRGCAARDVVTINVLPTLTLPTPVISPKDVAGFCASDSLTLFIDAKSGYTYRWMRNGASVPNSNAPQLTVHTAGVYAVVVETEGCAAKRSAERKISTSTTPIVSVSTTAATCPACDDGTITVASPLENAPYTYSVDGVFFYETPLFKHLRYGKYSVYVRDPFGCDTTLTAEVKLLSSRPETEVPTWQVYPNPTDGVLHLRLDRAATAGRLALMDMAGRSVYELDLDFDHRTELSLTLPELAPGVYGLRLTVGKQVLTQKLMVR